MHNLQAFVTLLWLLTLANCVPIRMDTDPELHSNYSSEDLTDANILANVLKRFDRSTNGGDLGFVAPTELETPADQFKRYYACIRKKNKKYGKETRQAMLYQEGQNVELSCNLCRRPDQDISHYSIAWKRLQQEIGQESFVPEDSNRFVLTDEKSLIIKDIDVLDAGQYVCQREGQYESIYQVDVLFKEPRRVINDANVVNSSTNAPQFLVHLSISLCSGQFCEHGPEILALASSNRCAHGVFHDCGQSSVDSHQFFLIQYIGENLSEHMELRTRGRNISSAQGLDWAGTMIFGSCTRNWSQENRWIEITEDDPEAKPLDEVFLTDHNIHVFTTWSEWSECNKCGERGLRRRIGLCTVTKISKTDPITPVDMPSIQFYPHGVPCRSTVLPHRIARMAYISDRQSETLMGKCFIPCPTVAKVETVTDQSGTVIRQVDIQYYSLNEVPVMPEVVKRELIHKDAGRKLILTCPSENNQKESLIRWQNGTTVINPLLIKRATRGRVRIDHSNRLLIRRLRVTDTAPYNCWEGARHIATIKVIVTQPLNKDIKKYISIAGCAVTLLAVIIIAVCVCCGGRKRTAR